eukprot:Clim_evm49s236 gene=Clim_evmTU49s236
MVVDKGTSTAAGPDPAKFHSLTTQIFQEPGNQRKSSKQAIESQSSRGRKRRKNPDQSKGKGKDHALASLDLRLMARSEALFPSTPTDAARLSMHSRMSGPEFNTSNRKVEAVSVGDGAALNEGTDSKALTVSRKGTESIGPKDEKQRKIEDQTIDLMANPYSKDRGQTMETSGAAKKDSTVVVVKSSITGRLIELPKPPHVPKPIWHAPWTLSRLIRGHAGWITCIDVDVSNDWFVTGSNDRTLKVWDLALGSLKVTLTGHLGSVKCCRVSDRHPYLFSAGDDFQIKCWDLTVNRVIKQYHGHSAGVLTVDVHPALDVVVSGGRDSTVRVWDIRSSRGALTMRTSSKDAAVTTLKCQKADPQIITAGMDGAVRLWDLRAMGKCVATLTHHRGSVKGLTLHPAEWTFVTGAKDGLRKWQFPDGRFLQHLPFQRTTGTENDAAVVGIENNCNVVCVNDDDVLLAGMDNGRVLLHDYRSGHRFQVLTAPLQQGSLDSEAGILSATFDRSGSRLLTVGTDKTIKVWKEDADATPESHPVDVRGWERELTARRQKR